MDHKNAKAGLALSVKDLLEQARAVLLLDKFTGYDTEWMKRSRYKRAVNNPTRITYYNVDFNGPWTAAGMRDWLDTVETISKELGIEATLETDYDATISANWENEIPYTEEEKEEARAWLEANPAKEPQTIQWRSLAPNMIQWVEDE